jgi:hypothetical protein
MATHFSRCKELSWRNSTGAHQWPHQEELFLELRDLRRGLNRGGEAPPLRFCTLFLGSNLPGKQIPIRLESVQHG